MGSGLACVLVTVLVWWTSTALILYLDRRAPSTHKWSLAGATLLLAAALIELYRLRSDSSVAGAYAGFLCGVAVWGWQEMAFLLGYVTGPRRIPCPPRARGWERLRLALSTIAHHELAIAALAVLVFGVTGSGVNQVGWWVFVTFWVMRQSAKLNLFLGVRNPGGEFLPAHLRYLETYFRQRRMNGLFPWSVGLALTAGLALWATALAPSFNAGLSDAERTGAMLVASLLCLAILEHVFLVVPLPPSVLWRWPLRGDAPRG